MLNIGIKAPDFSAKDQNGQLHTLADYADKYLLLYFYPRDNTPGCTAEACSFRDRYDVYHNQNIEIVGVSKDSSGSHGKFADRFSLPFTLLSDPDKIIMMAYDTLSQKNFMGKTYIGTNRVSYLIDPKGMIVRVYEKVNPLTHAKDVLASSRADLS
ncbi:MAG: thioredoxin-dependent thiol peroxidase [bacterium]